MHKDRLISLLRPVLRRIPHDFSHGIGLYEVLIYPFTGSLEWLRRHALILGELERIRHSAGREVLTVIDFGGAAGSLAKALVLYGLDRRYRVVLADIDEMSIRACRVDGLIVNALLLQPNGVIPLEDRSIDVAVSSDVFEHIPPTGRTRWANELIRVADLGQVHTFPADSLDGRWASTASDRAFDTWHRVRFGSPERWTAEHLSHAQPMVEDMAALFEPSSIRGFANTTVWTMMLREQVGASGLLSRARFGLRYLLTLRRADSEPPYKACMLTSRATG